MLVFRVCGVRQNIYVYSLYRNPDLDDRIFDCLLASMTAVQTEDIRASFLFVGDLNEGKTMKVATKNTHTMKCGKELDMCSFFCNYFQCLVCLFFNTVFNSHQYFLKCKYFT